MSRQDEKVFAEARELAQLRLEQCIADFELLALPLHDMPVASESQPLRRFQKLSH